MAKVVLEINDKELERFLGVVEALKEGMVQSIEVDKKRSYNKPKPIERAEPLQKTPTPVTPTTGKYIDPKTFKERLRKRR